MSIGKYILKIPGVYNIVTRASNAYKASVGNELRRYGLRYDDLLNEYDPIVKEALSKLPPEEMELRNKRLKRAIDLDLKKTYLPEELQAKEDIWNPYLRTRIEAIKQKAVEKQIYD